MSEGTPDQDDIREKEIAMLRNALTWVLPMAKGYAAEHPVGNNAKIVQEAENLLEEGYITSLAKDCVVVPECAALSMSLALRNAADAIDAMLFASNQTRKVTV